MDADSGRVLAAREPDKRMFPASTTKTMTAMLAVESGKLDEMTTISALPPQTGESSILLMQNEKFAVRDLVKAALIKSANDSCVAIAEAIAGNVPAFVEQMNDRARELGAVNTHFANPHGLHDPQHYTTARDLALIARHAIGLTAFQTIISTREDIIHGNWKIGPTRYLYNRNRLLFRWAACDGVKTGYTRQAGNCLIAAATRKDEQGRDWRLIAVVMKAQDSWSDAYNLLQHEGFEKWQPQRVLTARESLGMVQTAAGEVEALAGADLWVPLRTGETEQLQKTVRLLPKNVTAKLENEKNLGNTENETVKRGDYLGRATVSVNGHVIASAKAFAAEDAHTSFLSKVLPGDRSAAGAHGFDCKRWSVGALMLIVAAFVGSATWRRWRDDV
jgi:D-alanyl-D-alanine carboxypeptidase (penicillin-binding protein 5/6)